MTTQTHDTPTDFAIRAQIDAFFATIGQGFNAYMVRASRVDRIKALEALSDAELAHKGIARDRIVHHVFRDLMAV
ncbi:hypothetical protein SAMN04488003_10733 [Loktanella fryxellensis]|uniref:DUF1127 domain-containing protein n=1 Tax=Loktanella fryxellensis TaxID=245187 RepID=A0A1H8CMC0_9RHOB|nr:hypothetical protein [Loktanella fryxellensis]SEM96062.1 hypothetical protein SAMN04488003_10733 [Loktanella fryxellensis]